MENFLCHLKQLLLRLCNQEDAINKKCTECKPFHLMNAITGLNVQRALHNPNGIHWNWKSYTLHCTCMWRNFLCVSHNRRWLVRNWHHPIPVFQHVGPWECDVLKCCFITDQFRGFKCTTGFWEPSFSGTNSPSSGCVEACKNTYQWAQSYVQWLRRAIPKLSIPSHFETSHL